SMGRFPGTVLNHYPVNRRTISGYPVQSLNTDNRTRVRMLQSITFNNFKALRDVELPLTPFTLLMGPNGSGKSTVLEGLRKVCRHESVRSLASIATVGADLSSDWPVRITLNWGNPFQGLQIIGCWNQEGTFQQRLVKSADLSSETFDQSQAQKKLA